MMGRVMCMKLIVKQLMQSVIMAGLVPAMMISAISGGYKKTIPETDPQDKIVRSYEITVLNGDGDPEIMELETYLIRVLLGEVPSEFHEEALKAQAVAARTYTLYCIQVLNKHHSGAVCTDYHCCQAYCEPEDYISNGGTVNGLQKVSDAVELTAGEVLKYDDELICATYFASSGGQTEDALEVWGEEYPYLKSVESPGEEDCGYFTDQVSMTPLQLQEALNVKLSGRPASWFGMVKHTVGNGIDLMRVGGKLYTGVELRKLLKLRSTVMTVTASDEAINITTKGYGHRVGMSQHGADAMAKDGSNYRQILAHYYTDTVLHQYEK